jgi:hypothetical protein
MSKLGKSLLRLLSFIISPVIIHSCVIGRMMEHAEYSAKAGDSLPDTFRVVLPLRVNSGNRALIRARINGQYDMDFIIDTQASNLAKSEDLKNLNAHYRGKFPLATYDMNREKSRNDLYYFDSFEIASLSFGNTLFKEIKPSNYIYEILSKENKNVLGRETVRLLNWKFDADEGELVLFSRKDDSLLAKEVENGYRKIKKGLGRNKNVLTFHNGDISGKFTLDMGSDTEISIGKRLFKQLSKRMPYRRIGGSKGSVYLFENVDVEWNGIVIKNCQVDYVPGQFLKNFIGLEVMRRFNYILAHELSSGGVLIRGDLYLKPRKDFDSIKSKPLIRISDFGFILFSEEGKPYIAIEAGGVADRAGLKTGDLLVDVDNGAFIFSKEESLGFTNNDNLFLYLVEKKTVKIEVERDGRRIVCYLSL